MYPGFVGFYRDRPRQEEVEARLTNTALRFHSPRAVGVNRGILEAYNTAMADPLQEYKQFIDGLLDWPKKSVVAYWVRDWDQDDATKTYRVPLDHPVRRLVPSLSPEQREMLAELLQREHESGIHETLTYLEPYGITKDGVPLAVEPFGTEMHYDFVARIAGSEWPAVPVDEE